MSLDRARDLVEIMSSNGAVFSYRPAHGALPSTFTYGLPKGGDRWKCRGLIAEAKADPALWSRLVEEIGRRCGGDAS